MNYSLRSDAVKLTSHSPRYHDTQMPKEYNDLHETIIRQRRPELYGALWPEEKKE